MITPNEELQDSREKLKLTGLKQGLEQSLKVARERIFSIAARNRMGVIAPKIMAIGYAKVLFAAAKLGADLDSSKSLKNE